MKKFIAIFLASLLTLFVSMAYADGETAKAHRHCVCGAADCKENHEKTGIVDWQAWNGDTTVGTATEGSTTAAIYLYLNNDVTITDTLEITNVTVYLCLNGKTLTINKEGHPAVRVGKNQKFVLCDCEGTGKITGAKGSAKNETTAKSDPARFGAVNCQSGSNFVMYGGSISDNTVENANGGGIFVNGGTFTMYGGSVNNNKAPNGSGGAISVENGAIYTFGGEMNGNSAINGGAIHLKGNTKGNIRDIKADNNAATGGKNCMGGAIFSETSGRIEIHDVELSNNKALGGGGIYLKGAADNIYTKIHNANIHDNTAGSNGGGVFLDGNYTNNQAINIYDSKICNNHSGNNGGGIFATSDALLNLYGGTISGNSCVGSGGGIRAASSTYLLVANYENPLYIRENTASDGGGLSTAADSLNIIGKCEIEDNTATNRGGGVYINRGYKFLLFNQTTVTKNTAPQGGGIYLNKDDTGRDLEILGGTTIIGNTSSADGSANNLYLNNGRMFQFRKGLTGTEKVGVSVSETPTVDEPTDIEWVFDNDHAPADDRSKLIIPDNSAYTVIYEKQKHWLIPKFYTVTFDPNNGDDVQSTRVECGGILSSDKLPKPTRDGYELDSWCMNGAAYNFDNPINGDITLTARWIKCDETALKITASDIAVYRLTKPAVLFVASYDGSKLLDIKKKELAKTEKEIISVSETGINTNGATKIEAFLWDNADDNGGTNMIPLCKSATADTAWQTELKITPSEITVYRLTKPAVLFISSYDGNKLLDIKKKELAKTEKETISVSEIGINTNGATKIEAFLWDSADGNGGTNMIPLCKSAPAEL